MTSVGNTGKMQILKYGYNLHVKWVNLDRGRAISTARLQKARR
jgi:hypothetical protein